MTGSIRLNDKTYCKIIAHAAKYPHCSVNGVLLAKSSSNVKDIEFVDAIPLFHICINLIPMAEIALMQIDEYASKKGLTIAGYYIAPENCKESTFEKVYNRIIDKIATNQSSNTTHVILVNNTMTNVQLGNVSLKAAQYIDGSYRQSEQPKVSDNAINTSVDIIEDVLYEKIVDFDNHLDNISLDWTNVEFDKLIAA